MKDRYGQTERINETGGYQKKTLCNVKELKFMGQGPPPPPNNFGNWQVLYQANTTCTEQVTDVECRGISGDS
jgi:hypothetical protein